MNSQQNSLTPRESLLMSLLNTVTKEYKALLAFTRRTKPLKIIRIIRPSHIPGETLFAVQVTNKQWVVPLTAAQIISKNYNLNDFSEFHADLIRHAAQGRLIEFLKISDAEPTHKIVSKKFNREIQQHVFTIEASDKTRCLRTAGEIVKDKNLLASMGIDDIYDIGYTQGSESILQEKTALLLARRDRL